MAACNDNSGSETNNLKQKNVSEKINELKAILADEEVYWKSQGKYGYDEYKFFPDGSVYHIQFSKTKRKGKYNIDVENRTIQTAWENAGSFLVDIADISEKTVSIKGEFSHGGGTSTGSTSAYTELIKLKLLDDRFKDF